MRHIELLGASGVGKTFLYQKLFDTDRERHYLNVREACIKAAKTLKTHFEWDRHFFYQLLLHCNLFAKKSYGLSKKVLLNEEYQWDIEEDYALSFDLLKENMAFEPRKEVVERRIANYQRCITLHSALNHVLGNEQVVLFDEGALHHHHGLKRSVIEKHQHLDLEKDKVLNPDAVIYLELPFELHMARVVERKNKGINTFSHGNLSGKVLENYVKQNILEYKEKIATLKSLGVPILNVDAAAKPSENLNKIDAFITNLTCNVYC